MRHAALRVKGSHQVAGNQLRWWFRTFDSAWQLLGIETQNDREQRAMLIENISDFLGPPTDPDQGPIHALAKQLVPSERHHAIFADAADMIGAAGEERLAETLGLLCPLGSLVLRGHICELLEVRKPPHSVFFTPGLTRGVSWFTSGRAIVGGAIQFYPIAYRDAVTGVSPEGARS